MSLAFLRGLTLPCSREGDRRLPSWSPRIAGIGLSLSRSGSKSSPSGATLMGEYYLWGLFAPITTSKADSDCLWYFSLQFMKNSHTTAPLSLPKSVVTLVSSKDFSF